MGAGRWHRSFGVWILLSVMRIGFGRRGWKDILLRVYNNISEHRVVALAAGVTFYALLAIFPAVAALVSIYGLCGSQAPSPLLGLTTCTPLAGSHSTGR
jgi:uncharacterized BrkB/YihY/UPF0761 family membrane protein